MCSAVHIIQCLKMFRYIVLATIVSFAIIVQRGDSYRILCLFPAASISHQYVYRGLTLALNKRGHELVVFTPNLINDSSLKNYTEIDISLNGGSIASIHFMKNRGKMTWNDWAKELNIRFLDFMDQVLDHPDLRKLYEPNSNERFDLIVVEYLHWLCMYPLAARFDVPMIGIASFGLTQYNEYAIGNPILPSHLSNWENEAQLSEQPSFWQRLRNFVNFWEYQYWLQTTYLSGQRMIAEKYFGDDIPDLRDLGKNVSLIFVNQPTPISYPRPNVPKIIEISGWHIAKQNVTLPKDLAQILDAATEGFVYMSLGSNVLSKMMPNKTMNEFIFAFSRLPYKVLWKFEDDFLPNKPDNVHIMKWIPQQAVLAHPNLKVFVYQGGLQSTEEAVHHAVPLVGLPIMFDQDMQVNKMVSLGVAKKLEISAIDEDELFEAISTVATEASYKQNMLELRSLMNDRPYDSLENACWWTEYVIRHKGAPHLHCTTADEPWYTRQDMDIVAFISTVSVIVLSSTLFIMYQLFRRMLHGSSGTMSIRDKKMN